MAVFQMSADELESLDFAGEYIPKHSKVSHQRIDRMLECRRAIFLNDEMAIPREAVAHEWNENHQPPVASEEDGEEQNNNKTCTNEVEAAVLKVGVLAQVKRIKIVESFEFHFLALLLLIVPTLYAGSKPLNTQYY